jgi:membrane-bound lytic murein transglycosylase D
MTSVFDGSFEMAYHSAAEGRLMRRPEGFDLTTFDDADFGRHRWPRIIRAIQWARSLARTAAPAQAEALMPKLKAAFVQEGVPPELVWIAEVESKLDPGAESASGARGLFQFMPDTAERFGLLTQESDDRDIPEKSARAAAQYLAVLYRQFGNWRLALAGYNAGEGCVRRLLKRHHATTFEEIVPYLPEQTQDYVPRVMATLALRENVRLSALPSPALSPTWN